MDALLSLALASLVHTPSQAATPPDACEFAIVHQVPGAAALRGPEDIVTRVRLLRQPDSPIVIAAADFTEMRLDVAPGRYNWEGPHSIEILNVSDRPVHDIHFGAFIRWAGTSGGSGHGIGMWWYQQALAPGQRVTVARKGGGETGTSPRGDDVTVDVGVTSVRIGQCQLRPRWPYPCNAHKWLRRDAPLASPALWRCQKQGFRRVGAPRDKSEPAGSPQAST